MRFRDKRMLIILSLLLWIPAAMAKGNALQDAFQRSIRYEKTQDYQDAILALQPDFQRYPKSYLLNLRLGWLDYLAGRYANSIERYQVAINIMPGAIEPKLGLMLPLLAQEHYSEVEQTAYQVMNLDHNNYYANLRLIIALKGEGKLDQAIKTCDRMRALYPSDISLLEQAALLSQQAHDDKRAASLYHDLRLLDPEDLIAQSYYNHDKGKG